MEITAVCEGQEPAVKDSGEVWVFFYFLLYLPRLMRHLPDAASVPRWL